MFNLETLICFLFVVVVVMIAIVLTWKFYRHVHHLGFYAVTSFIAKPPLKICTFNIQYMPFNHKNLEDLKKYIQGYDVMLVQEFFPNIHVDKTQSLKEICDDIGYNMVASPAHNFFSTKLIDSGLVIFSKYTMDNVEFCLFNDSNGKDSLSSKGVLFCTINVKGNPIGLFNAHLQSTPGSNLIEVQKNQIQTVKKCVESKHIDSFVLGGDFNINILIPENKDYISSVFSKYTLSNTKKITHRHSNKIIDYFITKNIKLTDLQIQKFDDYSDHYGVSAYMTI